MSAADGAGEMRLRRREAFGALAALAAIVLCAPGAAAGDRLPVFDTHLHYSRDSWAAYDPPRLIAALEAAGVPRALVSSTPDDGSLRLYRADPDRFVPVLRPYRAGVTASNWYLDRGTPGYVAERLGRGVHRGIGEIHLFDNVDAVATRQARQLAAMAVQRDIVLHVHSGAGPVRALFAVEPGLKLLWAHAGMTTPPAEIGALLDRQPRLWAELSFRAHEIAPGDRLDAAWRELLLRHPDRFMIGTDTYVASRLAAYGELVDRHRQWLAQLPGAAARAIAYGNAVRLFGPGTHAWPEGG